MNFLTEVVFKADFKEMEAKKKNESYYFEKKVEVF